MEVLGANGRQGRPIPRLDIAVECFGRGVQALIRFEPSHELKDFLVPLAASRRQGFGNSRLHFLLHTGHLRARPGTVRTIEPRYMDVSHMRYGETWAMDPSVGLAMRMNTGGSTTMQRPARSSPSAKFTTMSGWSAWKNTWKPRAVRDVGKLSANSG